MFNFRKMVLLPFLAAGMPVFLGACGSGSANTSGGSGTETSHTSEEGEAEKMLTLVKDGTAYVTVVAGRCVSCDRDTLASIRVMPQCMNMGEAAGVGAALSLEQDCTPAAVSPAAVREILLQNGAILGMNQVRVHPEDRMD